MSPKTQELIDRINYFQDSGVGHPLTCGNNSNHRKLFALESGGSIYLDCPDCTYRQSNIPKIPSIENIDSMKATLKEWYKVATEHTPDPIVDNTQHRTIKYTVTFEVTEELSFDPADWDEDTQTMDEYQAYQMDSKKEYSEEMFELLGDEDYEISNVRIIND